MDLLAAFLDWIRKNPAEAISYVTSIVTIASILCAGTNTPDPNSFFGRLYKVLELLAFNFGRAKQCGDGKAACSTSPLGKTVLAVVLGLAIVGAACAPLATLPNGDPNPTYDQDLAAWADNWKQGVGLAADAGCTASMIAGCTGVCSLLSWGVQVFNAGMDVYVSDPKNNAQALRDAMAEAVKIKDARDRAEAGICDDAAPVPAT